MFRIIEKLIRLAVVYLLVVAIPLLIIIAFPEFIKIDWSQDLITFIIIFIIIAIPFLLVFLGKNNSSLRYIPQNIKHFLQVDSQPSGKAYPLTKLFFIIMIIVLIGNLLLLLLLWLKNPN